MDYLITFIFGGLFSFLPLLVVSIVGIVLSRSRLKGSLPRSSRFATIGFFSLMAYTFASPGLRLVAGLYAGLADDRVALATRVGMVSHTGNLLLVAAVVLFLLAILADRSPSTDAQRAASGDAL